jgi:hypothetical protein
VDWVHNPSTGQRFGPWWTQGQNTTGASPECGLIDDARAPSSPWLQKKVKGILPVLTAVFGDRGNGGVRPAVKRRRRQCWCSVSGDWGRGEEQKRGAASAVQRGRGGGVFYRVREAVGRRGGGRRWWSFTSRWF